MVSRSQPGDFVPLYGKSILKSQMLESILGIPTSHIKFKVSNGITESHDVIVLMVQKSKGQPPDMYETCFIRGYLPYQLVVWDF